MEYQSLNMLPTPYFVVKDNWEIVFINTAASKELEITCTDFIGRRFLELSLEEEDLQFPDRISVPQCIVDKKLSGSGKTLHFQNEITPMPSQEESLFLIECKNITKWVNKITFLEGQKEMDLLLTDLNPDPVLAFDMEGNFTYINQSFEKDLNYTREELIGTPFMPIVVQNDLTKAIEHLQHTIRGEHQEPITCTLQTKRGNYLTYQLNCIPLIANGVIKGAYTIAKNITQSIKDKETIEHMAFHDQLTQLPNRRKFMTDLSNELNKTNTKKTKVGLMFLDLDRFKILNDSLGHSYGDKVLVKVANRIHSILESNQTVYRLGGDEFMILVKDFTSEKDITPLADRIITAVNSPITIDQEDVFLTTSIGVSLCPNDGVDAESLVKFADIAMYRAKDSGKNNVQFYSCMEASEEKLVLQNHFYRALTNDEIEVYYQPQVETKTEKVISLEALVRWNHPEFGMIPPTQFISIAEETGLIVPLGKHVLREATKQLRIWRNEGHDLRIGVNVSLRELMQRKYVDNVLEILKENEIEPDMVELEVTESMVMDYKAIVPVLIELKEYGFHISIDDFGTGYSSLSYLRRLPVDMIKIDRTFIKDLLKDENDKTLVKAIISMAHNLKLSVTAEGVETIDQLMILRDDDCDKIQGYYYGKPMPADTVGQKYFQNNDTPI